MAIVDRVGGSVLTFFEFAGSIAQCERRLQETAAHLDSYLWKIGK